MVAMSPLSVMTVSLCLSVGKLHSVVHCWYHRTNNVASLHMLCRILLCYVLQFLLMSIVVTWSKPTQLHAEHLFEPGKVRVVSSVWHQWSPVSYFSSTFGIVISQKLRVANHLQTICYGLLQDKNEFIVIYICSNHTLPI